MANIEKNANFQVLYNTGERIIKQFYKVIFLETCFYFRVIPKGLRIKKHSQSINAEKVQEKWNGVLNDAERSILKITIDEDIYSMHDFFVVLVQHLITIFWGIRRMISGMG